MAKMYYEQDADIAFLQGKRVAILGFEAKAMHMPST